MVAYSIDQIAYWVNGTIIFNENFNRSLSHLSTDSRKIAFPETTVFFALITPQRNGHAFLKHAYDLGVRVFVVSDEIGLVDLKQATFILVPDTLKALQLLASQHRQQFSLPIIGITGSHGKTVVKEWLFQLLQSDFSIVRSPKSYNSQIGVPLSIWQIQQSHQLGIFEAGISQSGEMTTLQKIIQPTLGILTNIGAPHSEGFKNNTEKLLEKWQLFSSANTIIARKQDVELLPLDFIKNSNPQILTIGNTADCNFCFLIKEKTISNCKVTLIYKENDINFLIPFADDASIENAITCICTLLVLQIDPKIIQERLGHLHSIEMRLEWKRGINHCFILNDSYSNDLQSLQIALESLNQQKQTEKLTLILSDFSEIPADATEFYATVFEVIKRYGITRLITIGNKISSYANTLIGENIFHQYFDSTEGFLNGFHTLKFNRENILVKGARVFCFEKIVESLQQQVHETVLEVNLNAVSHRLKGYRSLLAPSTKIMVMLKAFGYGSGDAEIASLLQFSAVDYLAVAYTDEGVALRQAGIHLPIMVMNPEPSGFHFLEQYNLEPELYDFDILNQFIKWCQQNGIDNFPVHIKLDTGMHRLGFEEESISALINILQSSSTVMVKSVFTHLVASEDDSADAFTAKQAEDFQLISNELQQALGYGFIRHIANTTAISRHKYLHLDMVRLGIGLYAGSNVINGEVQLPVLTLNTTVAQIKKVKAGNSVGYGLYPKLKTDALIATVRIGYADGFPRQLSNGVGFMLVKGQAAPVIGRVCMDMTMLDITNISGVKIGDTVEVFGPSLPLETLARQCNTIIYEIITGISQRVKRVYLSE